MKASVYLPLRRQPLTAAEYRAMPESPAKRSLFDGMLIEEPSASDEHQNIVGNLFSALFGFVRIHRLGAVRMAPLDVWLTEEEVVQPDVLFVSEEHRSIMRANGIHGAPDLVAEIASPATRRWDRSAKRQRYAQRGVKELWLIEPDTRQVEIHRFAECPSGALHTLSSAREITSPLLPGFRLAVWRLFER